MNLFDCGTSDFFDGVCAAVGVIALLVLVWWVMNGGEVSLTYMVFIGTRRAMWWDDPMEARCR